MRTRSHSSSLAQSETLDRECDTEPNGSHCNVIEVHLSRALKGAKELHKELAFLRKRNEALEARLESVEQAVDISIQPKRGKRSGPTVSKLQGDVRKLNSRIQQLEKARQKDRKKMDKLRMKEIKADAAELKADVEFEVGDSAYRMRKVGIKPLQHLDALPIHAIHDLKLLRRFHDLIISTSIEENEECPICMDNLENNKCASLPCEHTFYKSCISKISPGSESLTCPQCRATCPRDEIEVVQLTALQQWDALLDVAKAWARMDRRREEDTSEEEAEEEFIDDERSAINTSSSESALLGPLASSPEPEADGVHDEVEPQIQEAIPTPHKKRHIACTPDSLPEIS
ncbi:hypothetical protein AcW2_006016 [Taiwanofungus camphoratus]|nr:hypothetical protein AcW2_006016 [Antrodia cinnamomea]